MTTQQSCWAAVLPLTRFLALDVPSPQQPSEMPEWKQAVLGKNPTYGKITNLSILEQRQSLPIYQLREELLKAIDENQVRMRTMCCCVGGPLVLCISRESGLLYACASG